jgi:transketolase
MHSMQMNQQQTKARQAAVDVAERVGGIHFGGILSVIDALLAYYSVAHERLARLGDASLIDSYYRGEVNPLHTDLVLSKGHCYLAQLIALDTVFGHATYTESYMTSISRCGHPKRDVRNFHFPVSSGALGQGVAFAVGVAMAAKRASARRRVFVITGDGELNEGAAVEAMRLAACFHLPISIAVDDNDQISLGRNLLGIRDYDGFARGIGVSSVELNGNDYESCVSMSEVLFDRTDDPPRLVRLRTVKGAGIPFMEREPKWHHRRLSGDELVSARMLLEAHK